MWSLRTLSGVGAISLLWRFWAWLPGNLSFDLRRAWNLPLAPPVGKFFRWVGPCILLNCWVLAKRCSVATLLPIRWLPFEFRCCPSEAFLLSYWVGKMLLLNKACESGWSRSCILFGFSFILEERATCWTFWSWCAWVAAWGSRLEREECCFARSWAWSIASGSG